MRGNGSSAADPVRQHPVVRPRATELPLPMLGTLLILVVVVDRAACRAARGNAATEPAGIGAWAAVTPPDDRGDAGLGSGTDNLTLSGGYP